jgi:hypothetical protein
MRWVLADTARALLLDTVERDRPRPDGRWPEQAARHSCKPR